MYKQSIQELILRITLPLLFVITALQQVSAKNTNQENEVIRIPIVNTHDYSGLMDYLLADFKKHSGYKI